VILFLALSDNEQAATNRLITVQAHLRVGQTTIVDVDPSGLHQATRLGP
jgi:hypothetical protein